MEIKQNMTYEFHDHSPWPRKYSYNCKVVFRSYEQMTCGIPLMLRTEVFDKEVNFIGIPLLDGGRLPFAINCDTNEFIITYCCLSSVNKPTTNKFVINLADAESFTLEKVCVNV